MEQWEKKLQALLAEIQGVADDLESTPEELAAADARWSEVDALKSRIAFAQRAASEIALATPAAAVSNPANGPVAGSHDQASLPVVEGVQEFGDQSPVNRWGGQIPRSDGRTKVEFMPFRFGPLKAFAYPGGDYHAFATGQFFRAIWGEHLPAKQWCVDHGIEIKFALSSSDNSKGGVFIPQVTEQRIIDLRVANGVFRANTRVLPMGSDSTLVPRKTGNVVVTPVGENVALAETEPSFAMIELIPKIWGGLTIWPLSLSDDMVVSLGDILTMDFGRAFALKEDQVGFNGDGTQTFHRIVGITVKINDGNHTASVYDAASGHTAFSSLTLADFEGIVGSLPDFGSDGSSSGAADDAAWYISKPGFYASMERLMNAVGGNTKDVIKGGRALQFLGYPVKITNVLNKVLTAQVSTIVCLFGSLTQSSTMGDRRGITISTSDQRYFEKLQMAMRAWTRNTISNHDLGDNTDAGPIVAMKTAAS